MKILDLYDDVTQTHSPEQKYKRNLMGVMISGHTITKVLTNWNTDFIISNKHVLELDDLYGSPQSIVGSFNASGLVLKSLYGGPSLCYNEYNVSNNKLETLKYAPDEVHGDFNCSANPLKSLEFSPKNVFENFYAFDCGLTSIKGISPYIRMAIDVSSNKISSFADLPPQLGTSLIISNNKFTTFHDIHKIIKSMRNGGVIECLNNPVTSNILGLMYIENLDEVILGGNSKIAGTQMKAGVIVNKHLPNRLGHKGVIACQSDLLDAGLDEYAKL